MFSDVPEAMFVSAQAASNCCEMNNDVKEERIKEEDEGMSEIE